MTKTLRKRIFYALVALFFILGTAVALYADGWRYDFQTWRPEKIGAIYIRSLPQDVTITLDNKPIENKSGFLSPGTLISDLLPRVYKVVLKASGYQAWHENASVLPELVTQFKYAVLIPDHATIVASDTVETYAPFVGNLLKQNPDFSLVYNGISIGRGTIIPPVTRSGFLFKSVNGNYYRYDFTSATTTNLSTLFIKNGMVVPDVSQLVVSPQDSSAFTIGSASKLIFFDAAQHSVKKLDSATNRFSLNAAIAISDSVIAWSRDAHEATATIMMYDRNSDTTSTVAILSGVTTNLAWVTNDELAVLQDGQTLYLCKLSEHSCSALANDVKIFTVAPNQSAIAALGKTSLEVFPLNGDNTYYRFNIPDVGNVTSLMWYKDDSHIFVVYHDHVAFLDLADISLNNFSTVGEGVLPQYDASTNSLYMIDTLDKLARYDFPNS
jgi:hypothetical protein